MGKNRIIIILAVLISVSGYGQPHGVVSYQILQTVNAARIAALGGNAIAVKDGDVNLGLVTPSLLDSVSSEQLAFGFTRFFGEANVSHAGYAHHFQKIGTLSLSIQNFGYGEFERTNEAGEIIGNFHAGEYVVQAGIGRILDENFSIGANAKYIFSQMEEYKSSALAADVATTYLSDDREFTATILIKNIGKPIKSYTPLYKETLPFEIQMGVSKKLSKAPIRFSLVGENLQTWNLATKSNEPPKIDPLTGLEIEDKSGRFLDNLGRHLVFNAEILLTQNFNIRLGYNYNRRQQLKIEERPGGAGITYGVGLRIAKLHLSYGRAAYSLAGVNHHFSLSIKFNDFKKS